MNNYAKLAAAGALMASLFLFNDYRAHERRGLPDTRRGVVRGLGRVSRRTISNRRRKMKIWINRIKQWVPKLAMAGAVAAMAGCAMPASTGSAASVNAAPVGQVSYAGTCIGYNTSLAVLSIARADGKLTPSEVQTISDAATVFNTYCPPNSLPANQTAAMASIATAVANINAIQKVVSPSTPALK